MTRVVYVNGTLPPLCRRSCPRRGPRLPIRRCRLRSDRSLAGRQLVDATRHLDRLQRSLGELSIPEPMSRPAMQHVIGEVVRRNRVTDGLVYMQVSRGAAPRDFPFTGKTLTPTFVCLARPRIDRTSGGQGTPRHCASSRCPTSAGAAAISRPSCCCRPSSPRRRPWRPAPTKPGSSTPRASSPKAHRATPGSSTPMGSSRHQGAVASPASQE